MCDICMISFWIKSMEIRETIPFPVWTIQFPVYKLDLDSKGLKIWNTQRNLYIQSVKTNKNLPNTKLL